MDFRLWENVDNGIVHPERTKAEYANDAAAQSSGRIPAVLVRAVDHQMFDRIGAHSQRLN
jgi:hypothetical protein